MDNFVKWFEIPASDFSRAVKFYSAILAIGIQETEIFGTKMGFFPSDGKNVSGAIVQGEDYTPETKGVLLYLNGGDDLQLVLDKVTMNNGKLIVPKTMISPEMGFFGIFVDTEGNKIAIHSTN